MFNLCGSDELLLSTWGGVAVVDVDDILIARRGVSSSAGMVTVGGVKTRGHDCLSLMTFQSASLEPVHQGILGVVVASCKESDEE
jgi:hypothetical protein